MALQQHSGRIFSFKGTFGFLEHDLDGPKQPPPRLYFSATDVEGSVQLRAGDEVTNATFDRLTYKYIPFYIIELFNPSSTLNPNSTIAFPAKTYYRKGPFSVP